MIGNGLQGTLLGVRATLAGYDAALTGVLMACFFAGFLVGAIWASKAINRVGHIRVFAALTSLSSVAILIHPVWVDPWVWAALRFVTGACIAGILVISESWLNESADNRSRGQLLAVYMVITFVGMGAGQLLMNVADPEQSALFILVSVLISLAAIPLLLSATHAPPPVERTAVSMLRLYHVSPLGAAGAFTAGIVNGSVFGMGAVYAYEAGLTYGEISTFMGVLIASGALLQWPIGKLSDLFDRRKVIILVTVVSGTTAVWVHGLFEQNYVAFLGVVACFSGFAMTVNPLSIAHTNDHLDASERVGASSGLVLLLALGSIAGPVVSGWAMQVFGAEGFLWWLAAACLSLSVLAIWRTTRRDSPAIDDQGAFVAVSGQGTMINVQAAEEVWAED